MELTTLGCWAPHPIPGGALSGYLLQDGDTNIYLEAGNGSFSRLIQHIYVSELSAVVVTHLHPDHYLDLFTLRHAIGTAMMQGRMKEPVPLLVAGQPAADFQKLAALTKEFNIRMIDELPQTGSYGGQPVRETRLGELTLQFVPNVHLLPAYAVAVRGSKNFVFSGDTAPTEALGQLARSADFFLCEASGLDKDVEFMQGKHLTARQAGELAQRAAVKRLMITHFYPEYSVAELQEQATEGFGGSVEVAREGETVDF